MSLQTANTEAIYISSSQQVGFGTSSPSTDVDIRGPAADFGTLTLSTAETTIVNTDPLGRLDFRAPLEGSGSNAVLPTARLEARATETFDATHNQTDLLFLLANDGGVTEKMRMLSSGGLTFNGDTASANAIDDYEEGTFTPVCKYGSSGSYTAYTNASSSYGTYVKVGQMVFFNIQSQIDNPSASNASDVGVIFTGLPYTSHAGNSGANQYEYNTPSMRIGHWSEGNAYPSPYINPNDTIVVGFKSYNNGTGWTDIKSDEIYRSSGSNYFVISGSYRAA